MVRGTHQRKNARKRTTFYGVTVSDKVEVKLERNPDGICVFYQKIPRDKTVSGFCAPLNLPLEGWFPTMSFLLLIAYATISVLYIGHLTIPKYTSIVSIIVLVTVIQGVG